MFHLRSATAAHSAPIWWPEKLPGTSINQTFDTTDLPAPIYPNQIQSLSAQIAPSGTGELQATAIQLVDSTITLTEAAGQPGRVYSILFTATLRDNETVQWIINQAVACMPPPMYLPPPPSPGFGTEIQWMPIINVATGLIATGTTQATASALGGFTSIFSVVPVGSGAILPMFVTNGSFKIVNEGLNALLVYPPNGAQINAFGSNAPVSIAMGGVSTFSTAAPLAQWTVS